jgi:hypothetical protein
MKIQCSKNGIEDSMVKKKKQLSWHGGERNEKKNK